MNNQNNIEKKMTTETLISNLIANSIHTVLQQEEIIETMLQTKIEAICAVQYKTMTTDKTFFTMMDTTINEIRELIKSVDHTIEVIEDNLLLSNLDHTEYKFYDANMNYHRIMGTFKTFDTMYDRLKKVLETENL